MKAAQKRVPRVVILITRRPKGVNSILKVGLRLAIPGCDNTENFSNYVRRSPASAKAKAKQVNSKKIPHGKKGQEFYD